MRLKLTAVALLAFGALFALHAARSSTTRATRSRSRS